jgi:hypothetical protein
MRFRQLSFFSTLSVCAQKPHKKRRCSKINTNDNIVERKFNQVTTDRQWRKHSRAHERAFERVKGGHTQPFYISPQHTSSCDVSTRDFDTRPDFPFTRAEIGKHLLNSRVGDLSCQKTLCGVLPGNKHFSSVSINANVKRAFTQSAPAINEG